MKSKEWLMLDVGVRRSSLHEADRGQGMAGQGSCA